MRDVLISRRNNKKGGTTMPQDTVIKEHRTVYISGPMTGLPGFNFPAFDKAAVTLAADGWVPLNPAELERQEHPARDYSQYDGRTLPPGFCLETTAYRDLEAVRKCDAIFMLKGWEKSKGARAEKALAEWLGKQVMYEQLKDDRICAVCDGGPGNEGVCLCGLHAYEDEEKAEAPIFPGSDAGRREYPLCTGLLEYFPRACAETAHHSHIGNEQHNPGEPLHWAKEKSIGRGDQIVRHLMDGKTAKDRAEAIHHFAGMCWRSLELFERFLQGLEPFDK